MQVDQTAPPLRLVLWTADLATAGFGLALASRLEHGLWPSASGMLGPILAAAICAALLPGARADRLSPGARPWPIALRGAGAVGAAVLAAGAAAWLCQGPSAPTWPALAGSAALAAGAAAATRCLLWLALHRNREPRVILVGPQDCRRRVREHLAEHPELSLRIVAEAGDGFDALAGTPTWPIADIEAAIAETDPDEVLISTGLGDREILLEVMTRLLSRPLHVRFLPDAESLPLFFPRPSDLAGLPAIDLSRGPLSARAELAKWLEDKAVATVALTLLGIPMLLIAAIIRLTSPGPALFVQERHGRFGRPIRVYKFRSMRAEHCTADVTTGKFKQAQKGDMRVTAFGRFLRNTSLDETPQFINVLFGDMSVVGPRPHPIALNRRFSADIGELMRRHYVKPGITGLAQISGARGETRTVDDMRRRVAYDLEYLRRWSLWLDVTIIARTFVGGWINRQP